MKVEIIADSIGPFKDRVTTFCVTHPYILTERLMKLNVLRETDKYRTTVGLEEAVQSCLNDPFIPSHFTRGDQEWPYEFELLDPSKIIPFEDVCSRFRSFLVPNGQDVESNMREVTKVIDNNLLSILLKDAAAEQLTIQNWWLRTRDILVSAAIMMNRLGIEQGLCTQLLIAFLWKTSIVTVDEKVLQQFFTKAKNKVDGVYANSSNADFLLSELSKAMLEAYHVSDPKVLKAGQWHIPYQEELPKVSWEFERGEKKSNLGQFLFTDEKDIHLWDMIKMSAAKCSQVSRYGSSHKSDSKGLFLEYKYKLIADVFEHQLLALGENKSSFSITEEGIQGIGRYKDYYNFVPYRYFVEKYDSHLFK